jgi:tripeptide aminopeptidase
MPEALLPSRERLTELFLLLAGIPSPSGNERRVADTVIELLAAVGVAAREDEAGAASGGDTGNLHSLVQGDESGPHVALGAHLDTVTPTDTLEPVLDDGGVFRNRRPTILGADNKAAVAAMLHATELLRGSGRPFPSYELFFTVSEEQGLVGVKEFRQDALHSPLGMVLDSTGPVGGIAVKAPSMIRLRAAFRGRAAHAGVEPERGRSAIQAASKAIAAMSLGRLDDETSANIGVIRGGVASNIVPDLCEVEGECRGHDETVLARVVATMVDALHRGATEVGVDVDVELVHEFHAFALTGRSPVVRLAKAAVSSLGLKPTLHTAGGGSDANVLNARGLPTGNLQTGMMLAHSPDEYVALEEIERLCALVLELIRLAPDYAPGGKGREPSGD